MRSPQSKSFLSPPLASVKFLIPALFLFSCNGNDFSPRPKGYFRIDLPSKSFQKFDGECPFSFEYHKEAIIKSEAGKNEPCWLNIDYPQQKATIHLSYKQIEKPVKKADEKDSTGSRQDDQLNKYIEDSRSLVYKHTVKASDIIENPIMDDSSKVFGLLYSLEGNTASSMQFYLTDSSKHFLRGALYFNVSINADSLAPVIRYIQEDILHLVNTFEWKE